MKKRNLITMVLLTLVTLGIYPLYWYCSFQNQIKKETGEGFGGFGHLIVTMFTFGIYGIYWTYAVGGRIEKLGGKNSGVLYLVLSLVGLGLVAWLLMQDEVNKIA